MKNNNNKKVVLTIDEVLQSKTTTYKKLISVGLALQGETNPTERARLRAIFISLYTLYQKKFLNNKNKKNGRQNQRTA